MTPNYSNPGPNNHDSSATNARNSEALFVVWKIKDGHIPVTSVIGACNGVREGHSEVLTKELLFKIISKYNRAWNSFDSTVIILLYPNLKYEGPIRHREGRENLLNW